MPKNDNFAEIVKIKDIICQNSAKKCQPIEKTYHKAAKIAERLVKSVKKVLRKMILEEKEGFYDLKMKKRLHSMLKIGRGFIFWEERMGF